MIGTAVRRAAAVLGLVGVVGLAGCGQITTTVAADAAMLPTATAATTTSAAATPHVYVHMSIVTGKMLNKPGWPEYVPSDITVPAHALVTVTITDFDNGPATVPAANLKVQGTVGNTEQVTKSVLGNVTALPAQTVSALSANDVAHTFTSAALHLNVPVPPSSTVTFSFKTGAPGTYAWQCFAPCGTGTTGWAGPMASPGYMQGTITVQ